MNAERLVSIVWLIVGGAVMHTSYALGFGSGGARLWLFTHDCWWLYLRNGNHCLHTNLHSQANG